MPQGLEVYNASGVLTLSITNRLARVIGTIFTGGVDGSYVVPNVGAHRVWIIASYYTRFISAEDVTNVWVSGDTITWQGGGDMEILYGVT
jgi:hypothetical protein